MISWTNCASLSCRILMVEVRFKTICLINKTAFHSLSSSNSRKTLVAGVIQIQFKFHSNETVACLQNFKFLENLARIIITDKTSEKTNRPFIVSSHSKGSFGVQSQPGHFFCDLFNAQRDPG